MSDFQCKNMNKREKSPNSITQVPFGDLSLYPLFGGEGEGAIQASFVTFWQWSAESSADSKVPIH
jgi:hypothetical protein